MLKDRRALDLPHYDGLLAGHHLKERGYSIRRRQGTDDWLLVATLGGKGRIASATVSEETVVLLPPGVPHEYGTDPSSPLWDILWIHFHPREHWLDLLHWPDPILRLPRSEWATIVRKFEAVLAAQQTSSARRRDIALHALESLLLELDARLPVEGARVDPRVSEAIGYILAHLGERLSIEALSRRANLSPSRFAHLFRSETGLAPAQFVTEQRMQRARRLLERTHLNVGEIAAEIGMAPFHFSNQFRVETGQSPREYRQGLAETEAG